MKCSGRLFYFVYLVTVIVLLQGCASTSGKPAEHDPWEGFNRSMFTFNDTLDEYALKPVAEGYKFITPTPVRKSISNFFSNLLEPAIILNDILQGKGEQATGDSMRFVLNSIFGVAGLFDVATYMGHPKHEEDFGQTLGVWGIPDGPYLVLPFIGPRGVRDGFGWIGDYGTAPYPYIESATVSWGSYLLDVIDTRARLLGTKDVLDQATDDVYIFVREAYRQRRRNLVYDGNPPVENSAAEDELLFGDK